MAYLLHVHITDAGEAGLIPDSLADSAWATGFTNATSSTASFGTPGDCMVHFFTGETELNEFFGATKVPAEHQATVDAWKTANNITVSYTLYDLSGSATDISGIAKY